MPKLILWLYEVSSLQNKVASKEEIGVAMKDFIRLISFNESTILNIDVLSKLRDSGTSWSEFCEHFCDSPCQYSIEEAHYVCQFEMLKYFRDMGELSEQAYPIWVKNLKEDKARGGMRRTFKQNEPDYSADDA